MSNKKENVERISETKDYLDALNNYYKLKTNYENSYNKEKTNIINNNNLSLKEKRTEYKNYKPKCINCKRPVGTLFTRSYDEKEFNRILRAVCGDIQDPCSLNITLNNGYFDTIPNIIKIDEKDIDNLKISLIKDKNNLLFGYITTEKALENFEKIKSDIIDIASSLESIQKLWMNINDNKERKTNLKKKQEEAYIIIDNIKKLINDSSKTNNTSFINDAVTIYVNQLNPILKQIIDLKYKVNRVDFIEEENIYRLVQQENSIVNLEFDYGNPEIITYNIGMTNEPRAINQKEEENLML
jgi:hypothetical protein